MQHIKKYLIYEIIKKGVSFLCVKIKANNYIYYANFYSETDFITDDLICNINTNAIYHKTIIASSSKLVAANKYIDNENTFAILNKKDIRKVIATNDPDVEAFRIKDTKLNPSYIGIIYLIEE